MLYYSNPFQSSVTFHIETSHLICNAKQMTGFYMECNTWLKWVNQISDNKMAAIFLTAKQILEQALEYDFGKQYF